MKLCDFLTSPAETAGRQAPNQSIALSSRGRLARNLKAVAFPGWAKKPERIRTLDAIRPVVESLPEMAACFSESMDNLSPLEKNILMERHLVSREHAAKGAGSGLVLSKDEALCVMINEEDHLRMQALLPGLQIRQAWTAIDEVDSRLEKKLDYAFSSKLGYLTACPTNLGTGIRVSAMLHLPGLVLAEQINQIIQAVNKLGLAVRGLYGEGGHDYGDNAERFAWFARAALAIPSACRLRPRIVHANDWQAGLCPWLVRHEHAQDPALAGARTVFTIHNLAYQGVFPKQVVPFLGLPWDAFRLDALEFHDQLSFMKAGLSFADALTTV